MVGDSVTSAEPPPGSAADRGEFSRLLRSLREHRSLSQADVGRMLAREAHRLGVSIAPVSKVTIGRYERGQSRPSALYAVLLCRSLSVEPADLALDDLLTPVRVEMVLDALARPQSRRAGSHRADPSPHDRSHLVRPEPHQLPADLADLAAFAGRRGDLPHLVALLDRSREQMTMLCRHLDKARAAAHEILATVHLANERFDEALTCCERAVAICREVGDQRGEREALSMLDDVHAVRRQWDRAGGGRGGDGVPADSCAGPGCSRECHRGCFPCRQPEHAVLAEGPSTPGEETM